MDEAALDRHRRKFADDPDATASFDLLEEQCFLAERWVELAELYRHRLEGQLLGDDPRGRARLQLRLGQLLEERLSDDDGALEAYRESARFDGQRRPAWQGLRRIFTRRESWAAVLQVAEIEAGAIEDADERSRLFQEMGEIWEQRLGEPDQAEQFYERARLERGAREPDAAAASEQTDHAALVQNAWISAARGDSHAAVVSLRQVLDEDPSNIEAIDMLVTVLEGAERHPEMADLLERRAALASEPVTRAAVLARLGLLREDPLADLAGARSAYERALAADPRNSGAQLALVRIYRLTEAWSELHQLLERLGAEGPPDQRSGALVQLGLLRERQFGDVEGAIGAFEEALALEPDCVDARAALLRLRGADLGSEADPDEGATREHRAVRVVEVLERKLARLVSQGRSHESATAQLRLRLAELYSTTLEDPSRAIAVLEPCLAEEDALLAASQRLALLYEATGRHDALIDLARRAAGASSDPADRGEWYRRAAETADATGNSEAAVAFYGCLLEERPGDRNAEAALRKLHRSRGEDRPLASLLRKELARAAPRDELALHLELARLLAGSLDDAASAVSHWRRALSLDPSRSDTLDEALQCADRTGGALHQLDLIDHVTAVATAPKDRARLLLRRGDLLAHDLGWTDEGAESWRRSLELDPDQTEARARLDTVATAAGV